MVLCRVGSGGGTCLYVCGVSKGRDVGGGGGHVEEEDRVRKGEAERRLADSSLEGRRGSCLTVKRSRGHLQEEAHGVVGRLSERVGPLVGRAVAEAVVGGGDEHRRPKEGRGE